MHLYFQAPIWSVLKLVQKAQRRLKIVYELLITAQNLYYCLYYFLNWNLGWLANSHHITYIIFTIHWELQLCNCCLTEMINECSIIKYSICNHVSFICVFNIWFPMGIPLKSNQEDCILFSHMRSNFDIKLPCIIVFKQAS